MKVTQKMAMALLRWQLKTIALVSPALAARKAVRIFSTPRLKLKKEIPAIFEQAEKLKLNVNGQMVHGYRWNHPQNRKVLILHGFDSTVLNFSQYIAPLLQKGYEVLAFDAPAHGKSDGDTITVTAYRDMILKIHEQYGPIQSFMAHSMGGLALSLAMETMHHDNSYRLALIAPATESVTAVDYFFNLIHLNNKNIRNEFDRLVEKISGKPLEWFSIPRIMHGINASVLWAHDKDDTITPISDAMKVKEGHYDNVDFIITQGLGHRRIYRDEKVANTIINFL